jgi:hypothetical protein
MVNAVTIHGFHWDADVAANPRWRGSSPSCQRSSRGMPHDNATVVEGHSTHIPKRVAIRKLPHLPSTSEVAMADTEELWSILLPSGEVRTGTLDQLDEAFNAGCVDASALVLAPGATEWSTIGALAGLDDEAPAPSPETLRPVAFDAALPSQESLRAIPFDADEPEPAPTPRKSRGRWIVAATAAAVATVAVIAGAPGTKRVAKDDSPKAAAAAPLATATEITTTATEPANPIASAAPSASAQPAAEPTDRPKTQVRGASVVPHRARPSDDPFVKRSKGKCTCAPGDPLCSCL